MLERQASHCRGAHIGRIGDDEIVSSRFQPSEQVRPRKSDAPAEAVGLADRGEIAAGKRADLIRVHVARDIPVVRCVWREGQRVA